MATESQLDAWSVPGTIVQDDLIVRIETNSGTYTNSASENTSVFDVKAVAGIINGFPAYHLEVVNGELKILTDSGVAIASQQAYSYAVDGIPEDPYIDIDTDSLGIHAISPMSNHELQTGADKLIQDLIQNGATATLLGTSAVKTVVEKLSDPENSSPYAKQIKAVIALAVNYANRTVQ